MDPDLMRIDNFQSDHFRTRLVVLVGRRRPGERIEVLCAGESLVEDPDQLREMLILRPQDYRIAVAVQIDFLGVFFES
jgi:hypothetical protein